PTTDFSLDPYYGPASQHQYGVTGVVANDDKNAHRLTQEIRLSASVGTMMDWLVGGFYNRETAGQVQFADGVDTATGAHAGNLYAVSLPSMYSEKAGFGDLTFHFTDRFDFQAGARYSRISGDLLANWTGPLINDFFGVPPPVNYPKKYISSDAFTYLL